MRGRIEYQCPWCGWRFDALLAHDNQFGPGLVPAHAYPPTPVGGRECPGTNQAPRNPESDRRPLWKDLPNGRAPTEHERKSFPLARPRKSALGRLADLAAEPHPADSEGPEDEMWMPLRKSEAVEILTELARLRVFEAAMRSMADQFVCPKTTAEEMARQILGGEKR